jgi:MoaA/NifB/PqqE/SkfB family radical SAM enzyme
MRLNNGGTMGKGYLSFDNFRKLIESNPFINEVELSNSGEIFLNPDLVDIMEYAYSKGVRLTAFNGVNFNHVTDTQLESLVKYHFYGMSISIDGASQDIYSKYRVNGDFDTVIENIKKLNEYKKRYNSNNPLLEWQYIIMEHNELDVPAAKMKAKELGIPIRFKLTWDNSYQPKHTDMLKKETGLRALTRNDYQTMMKKTYAGTGTCDQMFLSPQINWDGRLLGCCEVFKEDYGVNVFEIGLRKALQSRKFIDAKRFLLQTVPEKMTDSDFPCLKCEKRLQMKIVNEKISPFKNICNNL